RAVFPTEADLPLADHRWLSLIAVFLLLCELLVVVRPPPDRPDDQSLHPRHTASKRQARRPRRKLSTCSALICHSLSRLATTSFMNGSDRATAFCRSPV